MPANSTVLRNYSLDETPRPCEMNEADSSPCETPATKMLPVDGVSRHYCFDHFTQLVGADLAAKLELFGVAAEGDEANG